MSTNRRGSAPSRVPLATGRRPRVALFLATSTLGSLFLACAIGLRGAELPVESWWQEDGPVVPHDTFPVDCSLCHTSQSWAQIRADFSFDHEAETGVPLRGAHAHAQCLRCHNDRGPVAVFAQKGCAGCHEDVHQGELGRDCAVCHDERDWRPDELIALHDRTRLPLSGAHATTACWRCHPGSQVGAFRNLDPECVTCHLDDYSRASDPDHQATGFPTTCQTCHAPTDWRQAEFLHRFPRRGPHNLECARCHQVSETLSVFTCIDCHAHRRGEMEHEHDDVHGFTYESNACYGCHPNGRE